MEEPVVAVIGGGQLARMMAPAAARLGVHLRVLVESAQASAAQVVVDAPVGQADDEAAVERLAAGADVLTFEHEHVSGAMLRQLQADGTVVRPDPDALVYARDKIAMRERLANVGVPCPRFVALPRPERAAVTALEAFLADEPAHEAIVKTSRGGYDGKGVRVVRSASDVTDWLADAQAGGPRLLVESKIPFRRELAAVVARRPSGQVVAWPVVESLQVDGVCSVVTAPAPDLDPAVSQEAQRIAVAIAEGLNVAGVLAVEMFEVADPAADRVVVNELAMRPHNSAHWTIEGAITDQFEQHLRAVLDLPLGAPDPAARWTVMANVLGSTHADLTEALPEVLAQYPQAHVHIYGKAVRPGRKLGHVTVCGDDLLEVTAAAQGAAAILRGTPQ